MRHIMAIFLLLLALSTKAQLPYTADFWLNESNTPVQVNDMVEDKLGYIWLATDNGLYRFNGRSYTLIADSIRKPVTAVACGSDNVYAGYADGTIGYVADNKVQQIKLAHHAPQTTIHHIYATAGRMLSLSTEEGVFIVVNNIGLQIAAPAGLSDDFVYKTTALARNRILAATDIGLNKISLANGKIRIDHLTKANGLPDNIVKVIKRIPGKNLYWVGMQQKGIAIYSSRQERIWQPMADTAWHWGQVNDIYPLGPDKAWACTDDGYLLKLQLTDSMHLSIRAVELQDKKVTRLICSRSGVLWCGTNNGMTIVSDEYMASIPLEKPYALKEIRAMVCDRDNVLWFSQGKDIYRIFPDRPERKPEHVFAMPADVTCMYADAMHGLWIGTLGKGIWHKPQDKAHAAIPGPGILAQESILDIAGTRDRIWASGLNGVSELTYPDANGNMQLVKQHNKQSGIGSDYIYQVFPDTKGRIWLATDGAGIRMYANGQYIKWDVPEPTGKVIYNITEDANGDIWAASLHDGLFRYNGRNWEQLSRERGLRDINISAIAANATGQVVAVHAKGMDVWYSGSNQFRSYNKRQTFGIDSNSTVLKLTANDTAGNIYVPSESGMVVLKNIEYPFDIRPVANLSSINVFFRRVADGEHEFNYDDNHFNFHFDAISFANPEQLRYRYILEGYNDNWINTSDESATYSQLGPGTYTFRVQTSLGNNFSTYGEASYQFTIRKPFWYRAWFLFLVVSVALAIAYTYITMREKSLRKLSSLERERMLYEYEHLRSQVNPHFLFNSLNTLTSLIDENQNAAIDYTVHLSDLYRNMLSYRDRDLILLKEELHILEDYLYIQKSRFGAALQLQMDIPDELKHTKRIVPLALQLLVENAIKHNIVSKGKPLVINIMATPDAITVINPIRPKLSKEKGAGLGLGNIKKRYILLSKKQIEYGTNHKNEFVVKLPLL